MLLSFTFDTILLLDESGLNSDVHYVHVLFVTTSDYELVFDLLSTHDLFRLPAFVPFTLHIFMHSLQDYTTL